MVNEILHPEILLGRRGEQKHIEMYDKSLAEIDRNDNGWEFRIPNIDPSDAMVSHLIISKKFVMEKPPIYKIGRDFGKVLSGVKNDIPMDRLPDRWFGYIAFPRGVITDDTGNVYGAYVYIGDAKETTAKKELWGKRVIWISFVGDSPLVAVKDFSVQYVLMEIEEDFDKTFKSLEMVDNENFAKNNYTKFSDRRGMRLNISRFAVNSVLYINSLEPNIERLGCHGNLTHGQRKKLRNTGQHINLCEVPVIAVNWSYQRPVQHNMSETWRSEHMRWQRCGAGLQDIKLITIKGHTVKFKNVKQDQIDNIKV